MRDPGQSHLATLHFQLKYANSASHLPHIQPIHHSDKEVYREISYAKL